MHVVDCTLSGAYHWIMEICATLDASLACELLGWVRPPLTHPWPAALEAIVISVQ